MTEHPTTFKSYSVFEIMLDKPTKLKLFYLHYAMVGDDLYGWFSYNKRALIKLAGQFVDSIDNDKLTARVYKKNKYLTVSTRALTYDEKNNQINANGSTYVLLFIDNDMDTDEFDEDFQSGKYDSKFTLKLIRESSLDPLIYVDINARMVKYIIKNNIPVYYDYFDSGLCQYEEPITE